MPKTWRRCGRFTLVELLVVVAIIMLLMSLLFPSLQRARQLAHGIACKGNMKQLGTCFLLYACDNKEYFPPVCIRTVSNAWPGWESSSIVGPYFLNNSKLLNCSGVTRCIGYNNYDWPYPVFNVNVLDYYASATWSTWKTPWKPSTRAGNSSRLVTLIDVGASSNAFGSFSSAKYRHCANSNVGFLDGHVGNSTNLLRDYGTGKLDVQLK